MTIRYISSPAHVNGALGSSTVSVTVTAEGDALLVASIVANSESTSSTTSTLSGGGLTWTKRQEMNYGSDGLPGYSAIYTAPVPSSGITSQTITATTGGSISTKRRPSMSIYIVRKVHLSDPVISAHKETSTLNNPSFTTSNGVNGGLQFVCASEWEKWGTPTATGFNSTRAFNQPGSPGLCGVIGAVYDGDPASNKTYTLDSAGSNAAKWLVSRVVLRPATAPGINVGPDTTHLITDTYNNSPYENDGGQPITSRQWLLNSGPVGGGTVLSTSKDLSFTFLTPGVYWLRYTVTNVLGTSFDNIRVEVQPPPPVAQAGADTQVGKGETFTRVGSEDTSNGSTVTARQWEVVSGPSNVGDTLSTSASVSFTPTITGTYVFRYTVTGVSGSTSDDFTLTVLPTGVDILSTTSHPAKLYVEAAFSANASAEDDSNWSWVELTQDVRVSDGISMRHGKSDESGVAQPAECSMILDNTNGHYFIDGRSPYWPNIRRGVPLRVSVKPYGGSFTTVWQGYVTGWSPQWSPTGSDKTVELTASGALRRLSQSTATSMSALGLAFSQDTSMVAYWPLEETAQGDSLTDYDSLNKYSLPSGLPEGYPITFAANLHGGGNVGTPPKQPQTGAGAPTPSTKPLVALKGAELYGDVKEYTPTGVTRQRLLTSFSDTVTPSMGVLFGWKCTGSLDLFEVRVTPGGALGIAAWQGTNLVFQNYIGFGVGGETGLVSLTVTDSSGDCEWILRYKDAADTGGYAVASSGTISGHTIGRVTRVQLNTDGVLDDTIVGHVALDTDGVWLGSELMQLWSHASEWPTSRGSSGKGRLGRLSDEYGIPIHLQGDGTPTALSDADRLGPQRVATPLELLRDVEAVNGGVLYDGLNTGLSYSTGALLSRGYVALELDAENSEVGLPFQAVQDDFGITNKVTITRRGGSSITSEKSTGLMGTESIGVYHTSSELNLYLDHDLYNHAGKALNAGTVGGYRWPNVELTLEAAPHLINSFVDISMGKVVRINNITQVASYAMDDTMDLQVWGWAQYITPHTWHVTCNCSVFENTGAGLSTPDTGDLDDPTRALRLETDGSTLGSDKAQGATTLVVTTPGLGTVPRWTTDASDFPFTALVGGVSVNVTAVNGGGTSQTFTVDPIPVALSAGLPVTLKTPYRTAL